MTKRFGFTLAEVLITLGIIGVVAAMTIPTLMNQTGQAEFRTGFKKIMSTLNQAVTMSVALDSLDFSTTTTGLTEGSVYDMLNDRMNVIRTTTGTATTGLGTSSGNYTLFFNDGMAISFKTSLSNCTTFNTTNCSILVDVNGTKKPNAMTKQTAAGTDCSDNNLAVKDQFPVVVYGQQVLPGNDAARCIMYK